LGGIYGARYGSMNQIRRQILREMSVKQFNTLLRRKAQLVNLIDTKYAENCLRSPISSVTNDCVAYVYYR